MNQMLENTKVTVVNFGGCCGGTGCQYFRLAWMVGIIRFRILLKVYRDCTVVLAWKWQIPVSMHACIVLR